MKVVDAHLDDGSLKTPPRLTRLVGKTFRSYEQVLSRLQAGDTVNVFVDGRGYKSVGLDKQGRGWTQRNFAYEI